MAAQPRALHAATDDLPLFVGFVIEELGQAIAGGMPPDERRQPIRDLPAPFARYVARLLATLACTLGPISSQDLEAALGADCPDLRNLGTGVRRWLTVRSDGRRHSYRFSHPRLARAFARVIGVPEDSVPEDSAGDDLPAFSAERFGPPTAVTPTLSYTTNADVIHGTRSTTRSASSRNPCNRCFCP